MAKKTFYYQRRILLDFPFDMGLVNKIKQLSGAEFKSTVKNKDKTKKNVWLVNCNSVNIEKLEELGFLISDKVRNGTISKRKITPIKDIDGLNATLYDYQAEALGFVESVGGRALLALDAGLGKTLSSLAYVQYKNTKKVLIVVPSCVKLMWHKETMKWIGRDSEVVYGRKPYELSEDIVIINYDIVDSWKKTLMARGFGMVILDEVHYLSNPKSKRSKAIRSICKKPEMVLGLSGTPIKSKVKDLYNPLLTINKDIFPNERSFERRYCAGFQSKFGWNATGSSNLKELHDVLCESVMVRMRKQDVLKELPSYQETVIPVEINRKEYDKIENDFANWLLDKGKSTPATVLTQISPLRMECVKQKISHASEWIDDFLLTGEKLVVFGVHKLAIKELMAKYSKVAVKIDGSLSAQKKEDAKNKFIEDDSIKIVFANIDSAGTGTDGLQYVCNNALFIELPWNPSDKHQAISRLVRVGQKFSVNVYDMQAEDTFDQHIMEILAKKQIVVDKAIEGKSNKASANKSVLSELLKKFRK